MKELIEIHAGWMRAGDYASHYVQDRIEAVSRADRFIHQQFHVHLDTALDEEIAAYIGRPTAAGGRRPLKSSSRRHDHLHITAFLEWAVDAGYIDKNMARHLRRPRLVRGCGKPATDEQVADLLTRAADPWRTAVVLAAGNGLRCCSIVGLRREHVTEDVLYIAVGKGGRTYELETDPAVWRWVRGFPPGPVMRHVGGPEDARDLSHRAWKYFHRVLKVPISMHMLRRYYATKLDEEGVDILTIKDAMGHSQVSTTQQYIVRKSGKRRIPVSTLPALAATS